MMVFTACFAAAMPQYTQGGCVGKASDIERWLMTYRILVAYASKHGATAEIARKIGDILGQAGLKVNVLPADKVIDLTPFDAVVLGSAVYAGSWCQEAIKFLEDYKTLLTKLPVWLFSSGPMGEGDPVSLVNGWHFPSAQRPIADRIHARDIALFHGAIDLEKLNFAEKQIVKEFKPLLGDYRDWDAITKWAVSIVASLRPEVAE
ncbi:MAG: flavodoxin [Anaerolineaceae bacterium]|nr:flavodoxin [Anaerolineaceae bacterium]